MSTPATYRVMITSSLRLNIILTNQKLNNLRSYSHLVSTEQAEQFANTLENTLARGVYFDIGRCPICNESFFKQNRLCLLVDGRIIHKKCFWREVKSGSLRDEDRKAYWHHYFPRDAPLFDFSNLDGPDRTQEFRYAIQIISKTAIHLYLIEPGNYIKRHACLTYDECCGLIREIRINLEKINELRNTAIGQCSHCGSMIYADTGHYQLLSGEFLHLGCIESFIRSAASAGARLPARIIPPQRVQSNDVSAGSDELIYLPKLHIKSRLFFGVTDSLRDE